jgi:hypothetical protein
MPQPIDMRWEWNWPTSWWKDCRAIQFLNVWLELQLKGDHAPAFRCGLVILNVKLLDFAYYNIHHAD